MTCNEFKQFMETLFNKCEWKAVSAEGQVYQSKHWQDIDDSKAVIPSESHVKVKK